MPVSATWVRVVSWSAPKLITAASARNKSLNSRDDVPKAAPSLASGTNAVPADMVLAPTIVPDISTLPFISMVVAAICTSVSATMSSCPSVLEFKYIAVSRNCNFSVVDISMSSEN